MAEFPKRPKLDDSITVRTTEEVKALLIKVAVKHKHDDLGSFIRALFMNTIRDELPADFARIKGVG